MEHSDEDNARWAWLRAVEWRCWPLFLSQAVVPVLLYFLPWPWVIGGTALASFIWTAIVAPHAIWPVLSDAGPVIVMAKYVTAPLVALALWREARTEIAVLALIWPLLGPLILGFL